MNKTGFLLQWNIHSVGRRQTITKCRQKSRGVMDRIWELESDSGNEGWILFFLHNSSLCVLYWSGYAQALNIHFRNRYCHSICRCFLVFRFFSCCWASGTWDPFSWALDPGARISCPYRTSRAGAKSQEGRRGWDAVYNWGSQLSFGARGSCPLW